MVIQFLLPIAGIAGGVKVTYEYANYLQEQGHEVRILYPGVLFPNTSSPTWRAEALARKAKYALERLQGVNEATTWFPLQVPLIHIPSLEARYIPDADITVATSNETAEWVAKLPARCGKLCYFIQGHETWSRPDEILNAIYRLPLIKIVIASYLKEVVEAAGGTVVGIAPNGIDTTLFYGQKKQLPEPPRILMLSHTLEAKGVPDGLAAVALVRETLPTVQLVMFGAQPPRPDMPAGTEYHQAPAQAVLRQLYADSTLFLCPSRNEPWGLPAMEAMACGTAVVATTSGGIMDFAIDEQTALLVPPQDSSAMAAAMLRILKDPSLALRLGKASQAHVVQHFTLLAACQQFTSLLLSSPAN